LAEGQTITWETPEGKVRHLTAVDVVQVPGDADADSANVPS
jgi:hypothetical protein